MPSSSTIPVASNHNPPPCTHEGRPIDLPREAGYPSLRETPIVTLQPEPSSAGGLVHVGNDSVLLLEDIPRSIATKSKTSEDAIPLNTKKESVEGHEKCTYNTPMKSGGSLGERINYER